jgi:hypothetical protein
MALSVLHKVCVKNNNNKAKPAYDFGVKPRTKIRIKPTMSLQCDRRRCHSADLQSNRRRCHSANLQCDRRRCYSADVFPKTPKEEDRGSSSAHHDTHVHIVHILSDMKASRRKDPSNGGPQAETPTEHDADEEAEDFCPGYKDVDAFTKVGDPCWTPWSGKTWTSELPVRPPTPLPRRQASFNRSLHVICSKYNVHADEFNTRMSGCHV